VFAGEVAVVMGTEARGASNAKAKRELGWKRRYSSWREGFPAVYSAITVANSAKRHERRHGQTAPTASARMGQTPRG
jgi:hypothetical protein